MDKWNLIGYIAAIFNPLPTGLVAGYYLYTDKKYKSAGRNVLLISVILIIAYILLILS